MTDTPWYEDVVMPALLRHARATYGRAMRGALADAGYDDIPANGLYVVGALALGSGEAPLADVVRDLGMSKQAAGQLVDALVTGGYVERRVDPDDRRRLTVILTERGCAAAAAQGAARDAIDTELLAAVGRDDIARTKRTLAVICNIGRQKDETAR